jgi:hypothetical protein
VRDSLNAGINATHKLLAQGNPSAFVPGVGFGDVLFGFRSNNQFSGHIGCESSV